MNCKRKKIDISCDFPVPKIEIIGDRDMYVKTGSTVAIRCVIKQSLEGPFYVFWYHEGDRVLDYQLNKIDIQTKRIDHDTVSSLLIHKARREDSGNYTCSPSSLDSASVQLHVLNGEPYFCIFSWKLNNFREIRVAWCKEKKRKKEKNISIDCSQKFGDLLKDKSFTNLIKDLLWIEPLDSKE